LASLRLRGARDGIADDAREQDPGNAPDDMDSAEHALLLMKPIDQKNVIDGRFRRHERDVSGM
jgi:hypothetical protein